MTSRLPQLPGYKHTLTALAFTGVFICPSIGLTEMVSTEEWNISADRIIRYEDPQSVVAEGNIVLEKREKLPPKAKKKESQVTDWAELLGETVEETTEVSADEVISETEAEERFVTTVVIRADWMAYDMALQSIKARGNVQVTSGDDRITADQGKIDLTTTTGSFTNAVIIRKKDELHLEGKVIEKTGLNTYHIEQGWVITCKVEKGKTPPWSFSSVDTTVEEGGYAVLKHAKFNIKGVPVFYTPYMVIPVKNTRQTGLIFPEFSSSKNSGFGINIPFFWNISESTDLTLFPEYYVKRGMMPGAEFRYVRSTSEKGTFMASYLDDKLSDPSETEYYADTGFTHTNSDRYWVRGKADHSFGDGWEARLDMDIVSDRDYLTEFNSGYTGYADSDKRFLKTFGRGFENKTDDQRKNSLKFLKSWSGMSLVANFQGINDVRVEETSPTPLWKLPDVDFSGVMPLGTSGITFDWNTEYVNYWREDGIGAHRVDVHPTISSSIPLSPYLESRAELGVRDTFYIIQENGDGVWENDDTQNRLLADLEIEVGSTLVRTFDLDNKTYSAFNHQVQPFIKYNYLPDVDQEDLPQFDGVDSIGEVHGFSYGIDNFFNLFEGDELSREYGWAKISQSYDLRSDSSDEPFSDLRIRLGWTPLKKLTLEYDTRIDMYGDGFERHSLEGSFTNSRGDYFSFDYSFNDSSNIEQINALVRTQIINRWLAEFEVEHSISEDETAEANFSLTYQALCWSVEFQSKYTPSDTRFLLVFNLANIGTPLEVSL